jgi:hypothetical protein
VLAPAVMNELCGESGSARREGGQIPYLGSVSDEDITGARVISATRGGVIDTGQGR